MTTVSSFFAFLLISALAAPKAGDLISLRGSFSGRSSADFAQGQNVKFILPAGTEGRVQLVRRFSSGNYGLYVSILNGKYENRRAWVHYDPRLKLISLCESGAPSSRGCVTTRDPARATQMRAEKPVTAQAGPDVNAAVAAQSQPIRGEDGAATATGQPVAQAGGQAAPTAQDSVADAREVMAAINALGIDQGEPCGPSPDQVRVAGNCVKPLENRLKPFFGNNTRAPISAQGKQAFLGYIVPIAVAVQRQTGYPASILIAQAILETGWGRSMRFNQGNALFGYSCWKRGSIHAFSVHLEGKEHTVYGSCNSRRPEGGYYYSFDNPIDSVYAYAAGISHNRNRMWVRIRGALDRAYNSDQGYRLASAGMAIVDHKTILPMLRDYAQDSTYISDLRTLIRTYQLDLYDRRTLCV